MKLQCDVEAWSHGYHLHFAKNDISSKFGGNIEKKIMPSSV